MFDDDLRDLYQEVLLDHGRCPRNFRSLPEGNRQALGANPLCGDRLLIHARVSAANVIEDVAFEGTGCAISQASASLMTEVVKGKTTAQAHRLGEAFHTLCTTDSFDPASFDDVLEDDLDRLQVLVGVRQFPVRVKCATLAWHALDAALEGQSSATTEEAKAS